mmetsp:Transcript_59118/g.170882  ORF Transcript_59118/g.170882 Transcript_59118/m.170882 type:complete len:233 (+) Transcript_59118:459-1157(+)
MEACLKKMVFQNHSPQLRSHNRNATSESGDPAFGRFSQKSAMRLVSSPLINESKRGQSGCTKRKFRASPVTAMRRPKSALHDSLMNTTGNSWNETSMTTQAKPPASFAAVARITSSPTSKAFFNSGAALATIAGHGAAWSKARTAARPTRGAKFLPMWHALQSRPYSRIHSVMASSAIFSIGSRESDVRLALSWKVCRRALMIVELWSDHSQGSNSFNTGVCTYRWTLRPKM